MLLTRRKADPLAKFDRLLKDDAFWKKYRADLEKALAPKFSAILLAGIESGMKIGARKNIVYVGSIREKPFAGYDDFDDCVDQNSDKDDPKAYCAAIMNEVEKAEALAFPKLKLPKVLSIDALRKVGDDAIKKYIPKFLDAITQTTYDGVKDAVIRAREDGTGVFGVLDSIKILFSPERAQKIAVTETTRLYGVGAQEAYHAIGVTTWTWSTVNDPYVDPDCEELNGQEFPIDQQFEPQHPNCRCFVVPGEVG